MAHRILDLENTTLPDSDYIYGNIKDDDGTNNGTPMNVEAFGDMFQFFQRLMDQGGITPNGLPDNEYSGWQLYDALINIVDGKTPIPVKNTVFISKSGNDNTGRIERLDKPFLTYAAARAAAVAGFTGGNAPSATNKILFKFFTGTYTEQVILLDYCDYDMSSCIVQMTSGDASSNTITDNAATCRCNIYGRPTIKRITAASAQVSCVKVSDGSSVVYMDADAYQDVDGSPLDVQSSATLIFNGNVQAVLGSTSSSACIFSNNGTQAILKFSGSVQTNNHANVMIVSGVSKIENAYVKNTRSNANAIQVSSDGLILKNCTIVTNGIGASIQSSAGAKNVKIYGACEANVAATGDITTQVGTLTISANVS